MLTSIQFWEHEIFSVPTAKQGIEGEEEMGFLTNILRPDPLVPSGHLAMLLAMQRSRNPIQSGLRGISLWWKIL